MSLLHGNISSLKAVFYYTPNQPQPPTHYEWLPLGLRTLDLQPTFRSALITEHQGNSPLRYDQVISESNETSATNACFSTAFMKFARETP